MLLKTFMFDEESFNWRADQNWNLSFLRMIENHVNETIRHRGYIYLNQIYEHLGVAWNPQDDNLCVINDNLKRLTFIEFELFKKPNNSFLVGIISYQ